MKYIRNHTFFGLYSCHCTYYPLEVILHYENKKEIDDLVKIGKFIHDTNLRKWFFFFFSLFRNLRNKKVKLDHDHQRHTKTSFHTHIQPLKINII